MRSVFLPDGYQTQEPAGSWEHGRIALVLGALAGGRPARRGADVPLAEQGGRVGDRMATAPTAPGGSAAPDGSAAGRDVWDRGTVLWDLAFFVAVAAGVAVVLGADDLDTATRTRAVLALVAMAAWYAAFGARALHGRSTTLGMVYLAGMIPLFLFAFAQYDTLGFLLFVLYAQPWTLLDRLSLILAVNGALAIGIGAVAYGVYGNSWLSVLAQSGISLGFALLFGFWIFRIIGQSIDRRTVIDELERTRAELAAVSHRAGVLAERERLAREIHDTLAQGFTSWWSCWSWPSPKWTPTRPRPGSGWPSPGRPPGRTWPRPGRWSPR